MNRAFLFPGQGSQSIGMGKDFYDNFTVAKETFEMVDEVLRFNLSRLIFSGNIVELTSTQNTQPALMVVSIAMLRTLKQQTGKNIDQLAAYLLGHSLGEYSALCASSSLAIEDTAKLLRLRGASMQAACEVNAGSMAAILGMKLTEIEVILASLSKAGIVQIANDNVDGQVVISGEAALVNQAISIARDHNYKAVKLNVSAPFHCDLMKPAEKIMAEALENVELRAPIVPLITNVSARPITDIDIIKQHLLQQVCGRVRWRESINLLVELGIKKIVEIGAGRVLANMTRKANYPFEIINISNLTEFTEFAENI